MIKHIAKTFRALCDYADFSHPTKPIEVAQNEPNPGKTLTSEQAPVPNGNNAIGVNALQYHINIVLPDTRDQAVYDAIFKSMRDHLG